MTRAFGAHGRVQLQGANRSLMASTGLLSPSLFTLTFAYFIGATAPAVLPGAPFLLAGMIMLTALPLAFYATRTRPA